MDKLVFLNLTNKSLVGLENNKKYLCFSLKSNCFFHFDYVDEKSCLLFLEKYNNVYQDKKNILQPFSSGKSKFSNSDEFDYEFILFEYTDEFIRITNDIFTKRESTEKMSCIEESVFNNLYLYNKNTSFIKLYFTTIASFVIGDYFSFNKRLKKLIYISKKRKCYAISEYLSLLFIESIKEHTYPKINIFYSYNKNDSTDLNNFEYYKNLIALHIKSGYSFVKVYETSDFSYHEIIKKIQISLNGIVILIGHGNSENGFLLHLNIGKKNFKITDFNVLLEKYKNKKTLQLFQIFCCNSEHFQNYVKPDSVSFKVGHSVGAISTEDCELFSHSLILSIKFGLTIEDSFNLSKFILSSSTRDYYKLNLS